MSEILTFIIHAGVILILNNSLMLLLTKYDNIKEFSIKISFANGIEFKSLFYKK